MCDRSTLEILCFRHCFIAQCMGHSVCVGCSKPVPLVQTSRCGRSYCVQLRQLALIGTSVSFHLLCMTVVSQMQRGSSTCTRKVNLMWRSESRTTLPRNNSERPCKGIRLCEISGNLRDWWFSLSDKERAGWS